ncbi:hypothetical protein R8510_04778 [Ralstonia chuxiongensis]|nr:hypothetical protein R8510_04778 [Ralstonia chuxiongensis]
MAVHFGYRIREDPQSINIVDGLVANITASIANIAVGQNGSCRDYVLAKIERLLHADISDTDLLTSGEFLSDGFMSELFR